jgi:RNA polymerase sigma factor (sigma-70 family)
MLRIDVDRALARLGPRLRDVLVARFIDGESSAEIGQRYGRTEQTITAWLRQAVREMRVHLGEARHGDARGHGQS